MRSKEERKALHRTPARRVRTDSKTKGSASTKITKQGRQLYQESTVDGQKLYTELKTSPEASARTASTGNVGNLTVLNQAGGGTGGAGDTVSHGSLTGIDPNQHHNRQHSLTSSDDHTGILSVAMGGTGLSSVAADTLLTGNGTSALTAESNLVYTSTGLGVGVSTPDYKLHVHGGSIVQTGTGGIKMLLDDGGANSVVINKSSSHAYLDLYDASANNDVRLNTNGDSYFLGGDVGIGTSSPNKGSFASDNTVLSIAGSSADGYAALEMGSYDTDADDDILGLIAFYDNMGSGTIERNAGIYAQRDAAYKGRLTFYTSNESSSNTTIAERMRIDPDGKIGIGVTDPDTTLEVLSGTTNQLKLSFDGTDNCTFGVDTDGYLRITPSGSKVHLADNDSIGSASFASGFTGHGWIISDGSGAAIGTQSEATSSSATFDNVSVRGTLSVYELLIQQIRATNGSLMISSAGKVEATSGLSDSDDDGTITFESTTDSPLTCPFAQNDIIMCQRVNPAAMAATGSGYGVAPDAAGNATNVVKKIVYKVASVSANVCTVTNIGYDNLEIPAIGDDFVRIGNTGTAERQNVMYLTADDDKAPFIDMKADVDSYADWSAANSTKMRLGRLDGLSSGGTNEFGMWAGPTSTNYIKASSAGVVIKGSESTYIKADTDTIEFYDTNKKMDVTGGNIKMYADNGSTVVSEWDSGTIYLGNQSFEHVKITGSSLKIYDGATELASYGSTTTIGQADDRVTISAAGITIREAGADKITINSGNITLTGQIVADAGGDKNILFGALNADYGTNNISIGDSAGHSYSNAYSSNNICVGVDAGRNLDGTGSSQRSRYNVMIGEDAGYYSEVASYNTFLGYNAGKGAGANNASYNVAVGWTCLDNINDNDCQSNVAVGSSCLGLLEEGSANVALGHYAGATMHNANNNITIGHYAGRDITEGMENLAIGSYSGGSVVGVASTGSQNVSLGNKAGQYLTTAGTVSIGGVDHQNWGGNICVGYWAGNRLKTGYSNIFFGTYSGKVNGSWADVSGYDNICIGTLAEITNAARHNAIVIGKGAKDMGDDTVVLGNSAHLDFYTNESVHAPVGGSLGSPVNLHTGTLNLYPANSNTQDTTINMYQMVDGGDGNFNATGEYKRIAWSVRVDNSSGTNNATPDFYIHDVIAGATRFKISQDTGNMYLSTGIWGDSVTSSAPLFIKETDGQLGTNQSIRAAKTNIADLPDSLDLINKLKPVSFNYRKQNDDKTYSDTEYESEYWAGLIAEDVETVDKNLCNYSSDGTLHGVKYWMMEAYFIKSIQELSAKIDTMQTEINTLKGE